MAHDKVRWYNTVSVYQAETKSFVTLQDSASFLRAYTMAKGSCFVTIDNNFLQIGGGRSAKKTVSMFTYQYGNIILEDFQVRVQFNVIYSIVGYLI